MAETPYNKKKIKWLQQVLKDGSIEWRPEYEVSPFKPPLSEVIVANISSSGNSATATSSSYSTFATSASYAFNATSASYAVSASFEIIKEVSSSHADFADTASLAYTASYALTAESASYALTASYVNPLVQNAIITGSVDVSQGNIGLRNNAYSLQGTDTAGNNVLLIGVNISDQVYIGNQGFTNVLADNTIVSGSLEVTNSSKSSLFLNKQILTQDQTVPSTDNGMLAGPISVSESINLTIELSSTLVIL